MTNFWGDDIIGDDLETNTPPHPNDITYFIKLQQFEKGVDIDLAIWLSYADGVQQFGEEVGHQLFSVYFFKLSIFRKNVFFDLMVSDIDVLTSAEILCKMSRGPHYCTCIILESFRWNCRAPSSTSTRRSQTTVLVHADKSTYSASVLLNVTHFCSELRRKKRNEPYNIAITVLDRRPFPNSPPQLASRYALSCFSSSGFSTSA